MKQNVFLYGCCYYPEHWDDCVMEQDIKKIKNLGFNVVRMGEFSWSMYEPEEGKYDFSLLRRAVDCCEANGLMVILGTPTAAPPKWLTDRHPEVLCADKTGRVMPHGSRQHHNHTSEVYLQYCKKIVTAMALAFQDSKAVIGWQIDNELLCHRDVSYAESDDIAFQRWLEDKYGTIEALNQSWGTRFWSLEYNTFQQIQCPRETVTHLNPSTMMDFLCFMSDSTIAYAKLQYDILKEITPDKFITHNALLGDRKLDFAKLREQATDIMGYDSYPSFRVGLARIDGRSTGYSLSQVRGVDEHFLILEQQAGPGGQLSYLLPTPLPGQIRLWVYQSIGHGASGVLHFRYKTAVYGAEQLWYGVYDHDGRENYRSEEVRKTAEELRRVGPVFLKDKRRCRVAIYNDYINQCGHQIESFVRDDSFFLYRTLTERNIPCDFVYSLDGLDYQVVIVPHLSVATEETAAKLKALADAGVIVILSARSGIRDERNQYYELPYPGVFADLAGCEVEWFTTKTDYDRQGIRFGEQSYDAHQYYEVLRLTGGEAIGTYTEGPFRGKPAFVRNGNVYYLGTFFNENNAQAYADIIAQHLGVPEACDPRLEIFDYDSHRLVLNHSDEEVALPSPGYDLLERQTVGALPAFGVALFEKEGE